MLHNPHLDANSGDAARYSNVHDRPDSELFFFGVDRLAHATRQMEAAD